MADVFDKAQERDEKNLGDALAAQQRKAASTPKLVPLGYCQNPHCAEEFDHANDAARLFCNHHCAGAFQRLAGK